MYEDVSSFRSHTNSSPEEIAFGKLGSGGGECVPGDVAACGGPLSTWRKGGRTGYRWVAVGVIRGKETK